MSKEVGVNETTVYGVIIDVSEGATSYLIGRLLTLVETAVTDAVQLKALKDTLTDIVWECHRSREKDIAGKLYTCKREGIPIMSDNAEHNIGSWLEEKS